MAENTNAFEKAMSRGHSAAWDMEWEKAAAYYRQALEAAPDNPQALSSLASALLELEENEQALTYYQQAAKAAPQDPLSYEKIAQIFELLGQRQQSAEAAYHAAELYLKRQEVQKAIVNWEQCIQLVPAHIRAHSRLAMTFERMGRRSKAVQEYLVVASLLQQAGNKTKAVELTNHSLQILPASQEAQQALGLLRANQSLPMPQTKTTTGTLLMLPKPGTGRLELKAPDEQAIAKEEPVVEARKKALSALATQLFDQSAAEEKRGKRLGLQAISMGTGPLSRARVEHTQIMLHLSQAVDLQSRDREKQAIEELERAIDAGLDNAAAYFDLGLMLTNTGRLESGMKNMQHAVKHPDYALAARLVWGENLEKLGRKRESALQYLEALRLADAAVVEPEQREMMLQIYEHVIEGHSQEDDEAAHTQLCNTIHTMLRRPKWDEHVKQARRQLPRQLPTAPPVPLAELLTQAQSSQVVDLLSNIHELTEKGLYRVAMEEAFFALYFAPAYLPLHSIMAEILLQQDYLQEAIGKFNVVARAYSSRGEAGRAISLFRRITQLAPLDLAARNRLITQLTASGQTESTIREYINLAEVYYRLADLDKARETYQKALNAVHQSSLDDTWTIRVLHYLADIDMQRLDWRRALRIYNQIRSLDPSDEKAMVSVIDLNLRLDEKTQALSELGNCVAYLSQRGNSEQAIEMMEELVEDYPSEVGIRRALVDQYGRAGRKDDVILQWDKIADVLLEQGNRAEAVKTIRNIIRMNPPNADEYQSLLRRLARHQE